jgi:hypothetical protein
MRLYEMLMSSLFFPSLRGNATFETFSIKQHQAVEVEAQKEPTEEETEWVEAVAIDQISESGTLNVRLHL